MRLRQIVLLPVAALTTACAFNHARTPSVTPPEAYEQRGQVPLSAIELDRWWVNFHDPQLDQLIADAMAHSPDALTADQRLIEAQATRRSQDTNRLPRGNIAGNASS